MLSDVKLHYLYLKAYHLILSYDMPSSRHGHGQDSLGLVLSVSAV